MIEPVGSVPSTSPDGAVGFNGPALIALPANRRWLGSAKPLSAKHLLEVTAGSQGRREGPLA
jgi:hypothetical protein